MAAPVVVPVGAHRENFIELLIGHDHEPVEHLVLQSLDNSLDVSLQVRARWCDAFYLALRRLKDSIKRLGVFGIVVARQDFTGEVFVLQVHLEVASLLCGPTSSRVLRAG